jgi:predicted secreted protein
MRKYKSILIKEIHMNSIADGSVIVQTSCQSVPSTPSWFGEVALMAQHLGKQGILSAVCEHVRFARRRFGHYDVIDLVAVLFGYAISDERTLEAFYKAYRCFPDEKVRCTI